MRIDELISAFDKAGKRTHLIGDKDAGMLAALDMEGRLFTVLNGQVLNRVNLEAIYNNSFGGVYYNPGGDGLWPAPEGTSKGFQYATGKWMVPSGIRFARYLLNNISAYGCTISGEIDLVNNQGAGMPLMFERRISLEKAGKTLVGTVVESIQYLGDKVLLRPACMIAPWTLSQFNCSKGCEVLFPAEDISSVWDLYDDPIVPEILNDGKVFRVPVGGRQRFQIGLGEDVPWIEFHDPHKRLIVRREAEKPTSPCNYIDIRDAPPLVDPDKKGVRYSVYNDPGDFMEIEAAGGCPAVIYGGLKISVTVKTTYTQQA